MGIGGLNNYGREASASLFCEFCKKNWVFGTLKILRVEKIIL